MLKELIQGYKKFLLPIAAAGMLGFIFGIYAKPNQEGVYVNSPWVVLGRERTPIPELKLEKLSDTDISVLAGKVEELEPGTPLGEEFRELAVETKGPFKRVKLDKINIRLNEDHPLGYRNAKVCEGSPLQNKILLAHKVVVYPEQVQSNEMINIRVKETALCSDEQHVNDNLWLDRDSLVEWIPHLETLPPIWTPETKISANAVSVVSGY